MIERLMKQETAEDIHTPILVRSQNDYIQKVMEWEECDRDEAYAICVGWTIPVEPEYTLGYKLADPFWELAMFKSLRKSERERAIKKFREMLTPEEDLLFREQLEQGFRNKFRRALRKKGGEE